MRTAAIADYDRVVARTEQAFRRWRMVPPPVRGEVVRQLGGALRARKAELGLLVTLETGKIRSEGEGEVQEMIDMCDFAVGLSRQLYGLTIASERAAAPDARAMAAAGTDRHHHGLQFPGRRMGVERDDRRGLRRRFDLEAIAADATLLRSPCRRSSIASRERMVARESSTSASAGPRTLARRCSLTHGCH